MPVQADAVPKDAKSVGDQINRFGSQYAVLCQWAALHDLSDALELAFWTLGLDQHIVAIGNLVNEFHHPESEDILARWRQTPVIALLDDLAKAIRQDPLISRQYPALPHSGSASKTKHNYKGSLKEQTFLITLITHPLPGTEQLSEYELRRALRLWLIVQAANRVVTDHCLADRNISTAARFLIADRYQEQWQLVDDVLRRARRYLTPDNWTFERFTDALSLAAEQYKQSHTFGKSGSAFINAIIEIASGDIKPFTTQRDFPQRHFVHTELTKPNHEPAPFIGVDESSEKVIEVWPSPEGLIDEEADEAIYLLPVDATDTQAQQELTGRSFYQQQAETSHYLPWSYSKLLPPECLVVEQWVAQQLNHTDHRERLGGALVWLAIRFSRSLSQVLAMGIRDEVQGEWSLSSNLKQMHRLPPRRRNAWKPNIAAQAYVAAVHEKQCIGLIPEVREALLISDQRLPTQASSLVELWQSASPAQKIEVWFNECMSKACPRVTSGKLSEVWGQSVFDASGNHHFARMLTAHPNSALPGACSYASWDVEAIEQGLALPYQIQGAETLQSTNQGSLLVPLETQLNRVISEATQQLKETLEGNDLVRLHNQWTCYCVMALYAATGSRYLKDPFESTRFFNHGLPAVFVNDKAEGSGVRNGRMVPLADKVIKFVEAYLSYLQRLAEHLLSTHPAISSRINTLLELPVKAEQPLFFLLDESLNWHSMSATDLPGASLFDWPLPPNLFRHRLAQQLPLLGVDNEVVDGWLGHAEKSVATYGDTSARCWLDDWTAYRAEVNKLFERLSFDLLVPPVSLPVAPLVHGLPTTPSRVFGQRLREKNRRLATRNVIRAALNDIELFLKGRDIATLSADEINQLGRQMLLQHGKTPYPSAALRFSVLTRLLERHESPHRHAFQRRYIPVLPEKTLIQEHAPVYATLMTQLMQWATKVRPYATRAHCSKRQALALGAVLLCIEKRISYTRLLNDVCQGDNFRLLYHRKTYYVEYNEQLDSTDWQAHVQRHRVSYHVASLLSYGQQLASKKALDDPWSTPKQAPPLPKEFIQSCESQECITIQQVLGQAAAIVDQANLLGLPGVVASALAGRIVATSLPMQAYIRMVHGKSLIFPPPIVNTEYSEFPTTLPALLRASGDKYDLQQQAVLLFKEVKQILDGYTKLQAKITAKSLEQLVTQRNGKVSSAIMLLVIWIAAVIRSGKGRAGRRFKPFESSSLHRYWGALRKLFEELAYGVDLLTLSSEEVTAFYAGLIDYQETQLSDMSYFSHRLRSFHRVVASLGVEEPDWNELPVAEQGRHVRAEMLSEREYLAALKRIGATQRAPDIACVLQFILLCAYRFGLRLDEARGLLRRDWCEAHGYNWILVRNNRYRTLKSEASRRAVPLLFSLDAIEQRTINEVINRHDALLGGETSMPMLGEMRDGKVDIALSASAISAAEIDMLRHVSGSPTLSLHHARHAFYNIMAASLLQLNTPVATKITKHTDRAYLRQTVMGQQYHCSRRVMMGLARLMGHRQPTTGLLNYHHLILEWADKLTPIKGTNGSILKEAIKPQDFKCYTPAAVLPQELLLFSDPTPYLLMKALRLGALRQNVRRAGEALGLSPEHAAILEGLVKAAESNMRFNVRGQDQWVMSQDYPLGLLRSINDAAWNRLLEHASEINVETLVTTSELELHEVACQVGRHRHLLMSEARHVAAIALTIKVFKVSPSNYVIAGKNCSDDVKSMLRSYGLNEISETGVQLDMFEVVKSGREMKYQQYAGLLLTKNESDVVRNRYELAVAYLVTATCLYVKGRGFKVS